MLSKVERGRGAFTLLILQSDDNLSRTRFWIHLEAGTNKIWADHTKQRGFPFLAGFSEDARATRALKGGHEAVCTPTPVLALQAWHVQIADAVCYL